MKKEKLTKFQKRYRVKIYGEIWEKYKRDLSMLEIAQILKTSLANFYQIIKRQKEKQ